MIKVKIFFRKAKDTVNSEKEVTTLVTMYYFLGIPLLEKVQFPMTTLFD